MKLEKVFEVKDSELYTTAGTSVPTAGMAKSIAWSQVEAGPEEYDEAFLAALRDELKALEAKNTFVFIEPQIDKDAPIDQFIAAMKHTARRIKDCISVAGFAIPAQMTKDEAASYIEELSQKHSHYVYFSKDGVLAGSDAPEGTEVARY